MEKHFITAMLVLVLLAPQLGLEAKSRYNEVKERDHDAKERHDDAKKRPHSRYSKSHKKHKKHRHSHGFKAELKKLKRDISDIKDKIEDFELEVDDELLEDLKRELNALQMAIDGNFNEIGIIFEQIESINMGISALDTRLTELISALDTRLSTLELADPTGSGPPDSELIFSGDFTNGIEADSDTQEAWVAFRSNATGTFSSIEIRNPGTGGGSAKCSDPTSATLLAMGLSSSKPTSLDCDDLTWNVGFCGTQVHAFELNAGSTSDVCECFNKQFAVVRPRMGNPNWGGIGGVDCGSAPAQTIEVILIR